MAQGWAKAFYNSKAWKQEREYILKRDRYLCQCAGCHALATEVHHKKELTEDNVHNPMIALNPSNLMSVCSECHKRITKVEHRRKGKVDLPNIVFDSNGYPIEPPGGRAKFGRGRRPRASHQCNPPGKSRVRGGG